MANCEKCGNTFTPSTETTEVTSLRILCQKCEAERRAEKAARAAAATAAQATARLTAKPVATPAATPTASDAARPAATTAGSRTASGTSAGAPSRPSPPSPPRNSSPRTVPSSRTTPDASAPRAASPKRSASRSLATGVKGSAAKKLHGEASKKLYHKPIAGGDTEHTASDFHPDVQRELRILKQRESKAMTIAWIVCGILVVGAGGFALAARSKRNADVEAAQAYRDRLDAFEARMLSFDLSTEAGANQALVAVETEGKDLGWERDAKVGPTVQGVITRARASLDRIADDKLQHERLATVESTLREAASRSADDLSKARRTIESLENKGNALGAEFESRVKAARAIVDRALLTKLFEEAKALEGQASQGSDKMRAALNAYTRAENEATAMLDRVMKLKDEEAKQYFTAEFKKVIEASNVFVSSVFTPEVIGQTPWTDLLSPAQKENWQNYGVEGFRLENGTLEVAGPAAGATANGLIAIPKAGGYRDFVLEMEFVLDKGVVDFLFRLGKRVDSTVEYYPVSTTGQEPLKPGVSYRMDASFIGDQLKVALSPADATDLALEVNWTKSRKGAFGGQIHEAAQLKITRLRVRELRGA